MSPWPYSVPTETAFVQLEHFTVKKKMYRTNNKHNNTIFSYRTRSLQKQMAVNREPIGHRGDVSVSFDIRKVTWACHSYVFYLQNVKSFFFFSMVLKTAEKSLLQSSIHI